MGRVHFKRRRWLPVLLAGAAVTAPLAPALAVGTYELPPGDSTQPKPQGPVEAGAAPPKVATPAPQPTPKPSPTTPPPVVVVPTPAPTSPAPRASATPAPSATRAAQPAVTPSPAPATQTAEEAAPAASPTPPASAPAPLPSTGVAPLPAAAVPAPATRLAWWPWAVGGAALLAILGGLALVVLRRRGAHTEDEPAIEPVAIRRPVVAQPPAPPIPQPTPPAPRPPAPPPPAPPQRKPGTLSMAVEARALTISLSAATLAYRITLTNNGSVPLGGVAISGDMVSAHASLALTDQVATADAPLAQQHEIERIDPGESVQVTGELRLPFQAMHPIRKGKASLLIPLARLRVHAAEGGNGALIRTALVGQRAATPGAGLQPFRLDLGPRIYREVTQKIFS